MSTLSVFLFAEMIAWIEHRAFRWVELYLQNVWPVLYSCKKIDCSFIWQVWSTCMGYIKGVGFVDMPISTNPMPTIYRNFYENTGLDTPAAFLMSLWYNIKNRFNIFLIICIVLDALPGLCVYNVLNWQYQVGCLIGGDLRADRLLGPYSRTSYDISQASDWSRWPSRPIRSLRHFVTCTRIRALATLWMAGVSTCDRSCESIQSIHQTSNVCLTSILFWSTWLYGTGLTLT